MTTGHAAWCATWVETEPSISEANPPLPRAPTTTRAASRDSSVRACAGDPSKAFTVIDDGCGPALSLVDFATLSCAAWRAFSTISSAPA
jgi:hypothetical protein